MLANRTQNEPLYLADVVTGLIAGLAQSGCQVLSLKSNRLDRAFVKLFADVKSEARKHKLRPRFRIAAHPQHGDSEDLQEELRSAAKRDLISIDNPEFLDVRIKIASDEAQLFLDDLPGTPDLYRRLAAKLLDYYLQER